MMCMGIPANFKRIPSAKWFFKDNLITGIIASKDYEGSYDGVILPYGLSEEQRDLMLWAYEYGFTHGHHDGVKTIQISFKRLMNIDGFN